MTPEERAGRIDTIIAFDIDGTVDTSGGPIAWADVKATFASRTDVALGIVSPSRNRPADETPSFLAGDSGGQDRAENLRMFAATHPGVRMRIYVSDNGDRAAAVHAGFEYVDAKEFAAGIAAWRPPDVG